MYKSYVDMNNWRTANSLRLSDPYMRQQIRHIIGWNNGLSPDRRQTIIWTNDGILLIRSLGTNFVIEIQAFSFKKMHLKMNVVWKISII